jgi:hypothetical protein
VNRVTESWLRRFIHAYKNASFMDKMSAVRQAANPYYLLEWIVAESGDHEGDRTFWLQWEGERTPGADAGVLTDVENLFHYELPYELCFGEPLDNYRIVMIHTAFLDLSKFYGAERWQAGCERLRDEIVRTLENYKAYQADVATELDKLHQEWMAAKQEVEAEAQDWESEEDLENELKVLELKFERRKKDAPAKVLQRVYNDERLLRYIVHRNRNRPQERLRAFAKALTEPAGIAAEWSRRFSGTDGVRETADWYVSDFEPTKVFVGWLSAFISKSELTRGAFDLSSRQQFALQLLSELNKVSPERTDTIIEAVFRAQGIEEAISLRLDDSELIHLLVWASLTDAARRKKLREGVILTSWGTFVSLFAMHSSESDFERLSWVLCLDPESLQQRLLRGLSAEADGSSLSVEEIVRKCCALFAEGIRRGADPGLIVSLYAYLAKHDKEAFYSFVHGTKSLSEALPMFEAPQHTIAPLFRGEGVRQASARRHLLQLLYQWIESRERIRGERSEEQLCKLAAAVSYDKRAAVLGWLQRHDRDWRQYLGTEGEKYSLMRLLKFRWLGTKGSVSEQQAAVEEWLRRHSDWVQFESDTPLTPSSGMQYRIVKPGAIDAETGELLARVLVRMEWADREQVRSLLDDLRSL